VGTLLGNSLRENKGYLRRERGESIRNGHRLGGGVTRAPQGVKKAGGNSGLEGKVKKKKPTSRTTKESEGKWDERTMYAEQSTKVKSCQHAKRHQAEGDDPASPAAGRHSWKIYCEQGHLLMQRNSRRARRKGGKRARGGRGGGGGGGWGGGGGEPGGRFFERSKQKGRVSAKSELKKSRQHQEQHQEIAGKSGYGKEAKATRSETEERRPFGGHGKQKRKGGGCSGPGRLKKL